MAAAAGVPARPRGAVGHPAPEDQGPPAGLLPRQDHRDLGRRAAAPRPASNPIGRDRRAQGRMAALLDETIRAYPAEEQPPGSWWLPASYGGSAPTLEEAARLDAEEKRSGPGPEARAARAPSRADAPRRSECRAVLGLFAGREPVWWRRPAHCPCWPMTRRDTTSTCCLLVLGGTSWLGGATARHAAGARPPRHLPGPGRVRPTAAGRRRWVRADRSGPDAYDEVAGRPWDAVVEVSWQPGFVRSALDAAGRHDARTGSTCRPARSTPTTARRAPTRTRRCTSRTTGDGPVDWEVYGPAKVACELACRRGARRRTRVLLARAGLIGGYGDRSDRLGLLAGAGRPGRRTDEPVLVPPRDAAVQVVDVEDLAAWLVRWRRGAGRRRVQRDRRPDHRRRGAGRRRSRPPAERRRFVEAADDWLAEQERRSPGPARTHCRCGCRGRSTPASWPATTPRPARAGLTLRPLAETVGAALRWETEQGLDRDRRAGLPAPASRSC